MSSIGSVPSYAETAIAKAKRELNEERIDKAVQKLKVKYKERELAATTLANIDREIADLEEAARQGNL